MGQGEAHLPERDKEHIDELASLAVQQQIFNVFGDIQQRRRAPFSLYDLVVFFG